MKVAFYSPLPPERTGISEYSELLLPALRRRIEVEVVPRGRTSPADAAVCLDVFPQGIRFYADVSFLVAFAPADRQREIVEPWASLDGRGVLVPEGDVEALWASPRRVLLVARAARAKPWVDRGGRVLAERGAGAQRSDLVVVESRPRGR